ncbi:SUN domain-containing protein [Entamoeba marina]
MYATFDSKFMNTNWYISDYVFDAINQYAASWHRNSVITPIKINTTITIPITSLTNTASSKCGAKIISVSSGITGASHILNDDSDRYLLSPCSNPISFVVELCEPTQVVQFWIGTTEMFSNPIRNFTVKCSINGIAYETILNTTATNAHSIQKFDVNPTWCKFLEVNVINHYGHHANCPISEIRVFGSSSIDELVENIITDTDQFNEFDEELRSLPDLQLTEDIISNRSEESTTLMDFNTFAYLNIQNLTSRIQELSKLTHSNDLVGHSSMQHLNLKSKEFQLQTQLYRLFIANISSEIQMQIKTFLDDLTTTRLSKNEITARTNALSSQIDKLNATTNKFNYQTNLMKRNSKWLDKETAKLTEAFDLELVSLQHIIWKYAILFISFIFILFIISFSWLCILSGKYYRLYTNQ